MDWFSWLSKTDLDPTLSYEYGLVFARNKLQREDLPYFDHQFLQSMGISVAKHRLEILKLAAKEPSSAGLARKTSGAFGTAQLSKLIASAVKRARQSMAKRLGKWVLRGESAVVEPLKDEPREVAVVPAPPPPRIEPWRGRASVTGSCKGYKSDLAVAKLPVIKTRRIAKSGPLDGKHLMHERTALAGKRSLNLSGPLDRSVQERLVLAYKSPVASGPLDGNERLRLSGPLNIRTPSPRVHMDHNKRDRDEEEDNTLWAALFQDLKPN